MSFVQRLLNFSFVLENGKTFIESGTDTVTITGVRASAKILKAGFPQMGEAQVIIYGLTLSIMNQLSTLGARIARQPRNRVIISAGDAVNGFSIVFSGIIQNAWADFFQAPEVPFHIIAFTALDLAVIPYTPTSINGTADVVTLLSGLATASGLTFENNGVANIKVSSMYLWGSPRDQIQQIKNQVQNTIGVVIDGDSQTGTLSIWLKGGFRNGIVPVISAQTGMIQYPSFTPNGILVKTLFNKSIGFQKRIQIASNFIPNSSATIPANGVWVVFGLEYDLDTLIPRGKWDMTVQAYNPNTGSAPVQS
jgi:hypothetical protein